MSEGIADYLKRPLRYNIIDGIGEMGLGILFIGLSIIKNHVGNIGPTSAWHSKFMPLGFMAALLVVVLWSEAVAKNRITYRRTGYVKYRHSRRTSIIAGSAAMLVAAAAAYVLTKIWHAAGGATVLLSGLSMCALYVYWTKLDRPWRWIVAVAMAVGPLGVRSILISDPAEWRSMGVIGICWLISGIISFCLYLRNTRPTETAG